MSATKTTSILLHRRDKSFSKIKNLWLYKPLIAYSYRNKYFQFVRLSKNLTLLSERRQLILQNQFLHNNLRLNISRNFTSANELNKIPDLKEINENILINQEIIEGFPHQKGNITNDENISQIAEQKSVEENINKNTDHEQQSSGNIGEDPKDEQKTEEESNSSQEEFPDFSVFQTGDMVIVRDPVRRGRRAENVRLVGPLTPGVVIANHEGILTHNQIIGQKSRSLLRTHIGKGFLVQIPTLDEYTLLMRRHTTPIYTKDAAAMVSLLDLRPYSYILEAGSGNGSLTLYLARALYPAGSVHSIEKDPKYLRRAKLNIAKYCRGMYSPYVTFSEGTISQVLNSLPSDSPKYDGVALDMAEPEKELPAILNWLENDRFIVCCLPNMTQVLKLLMEIKTKGYELSTGKIFEATWKNWDIRPTVIKAKQKDKQLEKKKPKSGNPKQVEDDEEDSYENASNVKDYVDGSPPEDEDENVWICRPDHAQSPHSAFIVQLRKTDKISDIDIPYEKVEESDSEITEDDLDAIWKP
ncbi:6499_t:CDS:2 [Ambispora gerdemannii]|uniref:tRNA (adenine(58)-N(1))-methyltransferase catalytic subunit TRM61 n=1 Tax=Ambispora gerdemannii TaxID=144530 RepID=A0A9N9G595_9GLOM|nr:6499_t:CDS:2 [Ambispora gerdemannii]